ncbi:MFS transporter [Nocardia sp. AG03]|uniref:MFS transporter n=1 Tax=Nocardia sp. AG03 TaxID=3025312 RepID=UPI0024181C3B|nr:MFS transporter [Nocardia sp. AG03]
MSSPSPDHPTVPRSPDLAAAFLGLTLGAFLVLLNLGIVPIALPTIGEDLHASTTGRQWVLDSYNLMLSAFVLSAGNLGDRFGRKRLYLLGLVLFILASAASAAAPTLGVLIGAQAVLGVAAALLITGSLSLITQLYPDPAARARMLGLNGAIGGSGISLGPLLGGVLVTALDWRAIFAVNVVVGVLALWLVVRTVPESSDPEHAALDGAGQLLGLITLAGLTYALITSSMHGWGSAATLVPLVAALAAAGGFLLVESRVARPMLPLSVFRAPGFGRANLASFVLGFGTSAVFVLLALYLQDAQGFSPLSTGVILLPLAAAINLTAPFAGRLSGSRGPLRVMIVGYTVSGVGLLGLTLLDTGTPVVVFVVLTIVLGLGMGSSIAPTQIAGIMSLPRARSGLASGCILTTRQSGTTMGIAVLGLLIAHHAGPDPAASGYAGGFVDGFRIACAVAGVATLVVAAALLFAQVTMRRDGSTAEPVAVRGG